MNTINRTSSNSFCPKKTFDQSEFIKNLDRNLNPNYNDPRFINSLMENKRGPRSYGFNLSLGSLNSYALSTELCICNILNKQKYSSSKKASPKLEEPELSLDKILKKIDGENPALDLVFIPSAGFLDLREKINKQNPDILVIVLCDLNQNGLEKKLRSQGIAAVSTIELTSSTLSNQMILGLIGEKLVLKG